MTNSAKGPRGFSLVVIALLFLALPLALFWRGGFFFIEDDWAILSQIVGYPFWQYLATPDGEVWMPLSRAVYYGLVSVFGDRYTILLLINCLAGGVLAFLFHLFLKRHFPPVTALVLGLIYGGAAVQTSLNQVAFYNNALLCYIFFLLALLLTDNYLRSSSRAALAGIGGCAFLSLVSWNFTLMAVWALPLYIAILGGREKTRQCLAVGLVVGLAFLIFALGYFTFAGFSAAASHNRGIVGSLPGPAYFLHWFFGACLFPFFYLFWGHYHFPIWAYVLGGGVLALSLALIWGWGDVREKRLGMWALVLNASPFVLVSLARYQRAVTQAAAPRYAVFTLMGALLLVGTAWGIMKRGMSPGLTARLLPLGVLAMMVGGQLLGLPHWYRLYGKTSRGAQEFYQHLDAAGSLTEESAGELIPPQNWYPERLRLTVGQAVRIKGFLSRKSATNRQQGS